MNHLQRLLILTIVLVLAVPSILAIPQAYASSFSGNHSEAWNDCAGTRQQFSSSASVGNSPTNIVKYSYNTSPYTAVGDWPFGCYNAYLNHISTTFTDSSYPGLAWTYTYTNSPMYNVGAFQVGYLTCDSNGCYAITIMPGDTLGVCLQATYWYESLDWYWSTNPLCYKWTQT